MSILTVIAVIIGAFVIYFLTGCKHEINPNPDPEPEPDTPKWEDYYPLNWYKPLIDWSKAKWIPSNHDTEEWDNYIVLIAFWNDTLEKLPIKKGEVSDRKLYVILFQKKDNGDYLFRWTSDMQIWGVKDYWTPPEKFLILKDEEGNPDPDGLYRDDCDTFARLTCQYLHDWCDYWLVWFVGIYWKKKITVQVGDQLIEKWEKYGHAITVYKTDPESNWKCFSNQSWVSSLNGEDNFMKIVYKFVPIDNPAFADKYELVSVEARHPVEGNLLWQLNGDDHTIIS